MIKINKLVYSSLLLVTSLSVNEAYGYSNFTGSLTQSVNSLYGKTTSFSCTACHGSGLTGFGSDFLNTVNSAFPSTMVGSLSQSQFQTTIQNMANLDSDGDGYNNAEEFKAGTDPSNSASKPAVIVPPVVVTPPPVVVVPPPPPVVVTPPPPVVVVPPPVVTPPPVVVAPPPVILPKPSTGHEIEKPDLDDQAKHEKKENKRKSFFSKLSSWFRSFFGRFHQA